MIPEKLAPQLLAMLNDQQRLARTDFASQYAQLGAVADNTAKPERVIVFIHCDGDADLSHLADDGIRINQESGAVRTAFLPVVELDRLSDEPAVERIQSTQRLRPLMDAAADAVHLPRFHQATGLKGRNVVIGIIDSGIDPNHPAFNRRVLRVWDQTIFGPGVPEGGYGAELTGRMRDVSRDGDGHGTHVAGIASGRDSKYGGVATGARLVIVKSDLNNGHIADGLRYIFRVARELDRPAVVNFSFGGHGGPHDGSDELSRVIDEESGPGRIVCVAAGNEGDDVIHARLTLDQGQRKETRFALPEGASYALLNGWFSGNDSISLALRSPEGEETTFNAPESVDVEELVSHGPPEVTDIVRTMVAQQAWPNGDRPFVAEVFPGQRAGSNVWTLILRGDDVIDGNVDVWLLTDDTAAAFLDDAQDGAKIGEPATAAAAVTVASYTTRVTWTSHHGRLIDLSHDVNLHDISSFSSEGPLRDGRQKPDVAAPGAWIVSALSADTDFLILPDDEFDAHLPIDQDHLVLQGTSMACPFVTGVVALLLEHDPHLDPDDVKQMLRSVSTIPGQPVGTFDPKWGYGLIDMEQLAALI